MWPNNSTSVSKQIENRDSKRYLSTYVDSSIIHDSQNKSGSNTNICWQMNKQNVIYTHNEILVSLKKEGNSETYNNMNKP